ncbi:phospholipase D-like domain-containing protein [Salinimicrobium sp. TIG7-5_MAKvit]|uniref:phospholipase D-like domain-containing protein n=1 Tax=Salinimicrobium sp. TIG7-5_MAKvit TaxID=3121289 RepID=UPI003C6DBBE0
MIKKAESSIVVFTPYLDFTINKLLSKNERDINKVVVTSLDGENLIQRGYQIEALKQLSNSGVVIKNLGGLHAKAIIIDDTFLSLGSQNFTARGRKNKEAGFSSEASFLNSDILLELNDWNLKAQIVSDDLINSLIEYLSENTEELNILKQRFEKGVETIIGRYSLDEDDIQVTESGLYNSTYRFAQEEVILTKKQPPPNYNYYSFFAGEQNDLCKWIKTDVQGIEEIIYLKDYDYYPALNVKTKRMAFLRIHSGRITFMNSGFQVDSWDGLNIRNNIFSIDFSFLKSRTKEANVRITLSNEKKGRAILYYYFNSVKFQLVKTTFSNEDCQIFITKNLLDKSKKVNAFLLEQIQPYPFTTNWGQKKEIEKFLTKARYKVGIMEFKNCPILIFEEY